MNHTENAKSADEVALSSSTEQKPDASLLARAKEEASRLPNLLTYVVMHNGFIVDEHYAQTRTVETKSHIRSITKSITSALVGIAIDKGYINGLDTCILNYFPEYKVRNSDERKSRITLKHLLTMTAGFEWDELTFDPEKSAIINDWFFGGKRAALYDTLPRPLVYEPGTNFSYDSPAADLISVILTRVTGQDLQRFAVEYLFGPLGITNFEWEIDPAGFYRGSAGLVMLPKDVAKIGQLYLQKGQWQQRQILPPAWVEQSILAHITMGEGADYGLLWWVSEQGQLRFFSAVGYGGQLLLVVPAHQLVVAQHEWRIPAETAVRNSTDFYEKVF